MIEVNKKGEKMAQKPFQNINELTEFLDSQEKRIVSLEAEIKDLKNSINVVATESKENTLFIDEDLPETGLLSRNFLRRAFTVWGHYFVAQLIIGLVIAFAYFIIFIVILKMLVK